VYAGKDEEVLVDGEKEEERAVDGGLMEARQLDGAEVGRETSGCGVDKRERSE
jgi:hypothetical protein